MTDDVPADLTAALDALARAAVGGSPVLVALDFDGVLAPLQDDPGASRALPAAVMAAHMAALVGFTALVMAPYGSAIITGCL